MFYRNSWLRFGSGGTQGGVQKIESQKINYHRWALHDKTRRFLDPMHSPLVMEYFIRLNEKQHTIAQWKDASALDHKTPPLLNVVDNSSLDIPKWNRFYRDEVELASKICKILKELDDNVQLRDLIKTKNSSAAADAELLQLVEEDILALLSRLEEKGGDINDIMKKRLESDDFVGSSSKVWDICVTGKAGGEEANLFAEELAELFKSYAIVFRGFQVFDKQGPDGDLIEASEGSSGGYRFRVIGDAVFRYFRHEIGVHKVQRVPVTDSGGKMQTSTATFTLMPVLDPVSTNVREEDCTINFVRGSGPGGQGMQSSSNCVVLTHRPSGISVKCHSSRSALGNKEIALQMVAQQILSQKAKEQNSTLYEAWKNQWSSGERSDKMRTYNYPQNRVTDHRLGKDFTLASFMDRGSGLKDLHDELNKLSDREHLNRVLLKHIKGNFECRS